MTIFTENRQGIAAEVYDNVIAPLDEESATTTTEYWEKIDSILETLSEQSNDLGRRTQTVEQRTAVASGVVLTSLVVTLVDLAQESPPSIPLLVGQSAALVFFLIGLYYNSRATPTRPRLPISSKEPTETTPLLTRVPEPAVPPPPASKTNSLAIGAIAPQISSLSLSINSCITATPEERPEIISTTAIAGIALIITCLHQWGARQAQILPGKQGQAQTFHAVLYNTKKLRNSPADRIEKRFNKITAHLKQLDLSNYPDSMTVLPGEFMRLIYKLLPDDLEMKRNLSALQRATALDLESGGSEDNSALEVEAELGFALRGFSSYV